MGPRISNASLTAPSGWESADRIPPRTATPGRLINACGSAPRSLLSNIVFLTTIFGLITLVISGCTASGSAPRTYRVATTLAASGFGLTARLQGLLAGETNSDGTACFSITQDNVKTVLIWPSGFSAQGTPLEIRDESGRALAEVGKQIALSGGPGQTPVTAPILGCSEVRQVWVVAEVVPLR
jgi:hypothetical protein